MRQEILAGLLSGEGDPVELAAMMPDATSGAGAGSYAAAMTALTEIEGKQLAFASEAASAAEARYRETQVLLKRLGLKPSRFVRQRKLAMGGPYEPVGEDKNGRASWRERGCEYG